MSGRNCVCVSWYREEKSARGARAADVAERAPIRPGGPVQLTSKSQQINDDTVTRDACMNNDCVCQIIHSKLYFQGYKHS